MGSLVTLKFHSVSCSQWAYEIGQVPRHKSQAKGTLVSVMVHSASRSIPNNFRRGGTMGIEAIDHWVLVVKDLEETFAFYRKLGLEAGWQERPGGRGTRPIIRISETQKLNLYVIDRYEIESPTFAPGYATGSADFCLRWEGTVQEAQDFLKQAGVPVLQEPAARSGALGPATSLYVRDPDGNLIELITYGDPKYR
ncbi:MAG: hypothetical protein GEU77_18640 [Deltaproteobacteria bacterium]|nr:hypothetical protein [Deltaproteobacteria bacterium]